MRFPRDVWRVDPYRSVSLVQNVLVERHTAMTKYIRAIVHGVRSSSQCRASVTSLSLARYTFSYTWGNMKEEKGVHGKLELFVRESLHKDFLSGKLWSSVATICPLIRDTNCRCRRTKNSCISSWLGPLGGTINSTRVLCDCWRIVGRGVL